MNPMIDELDYAVIEKLLENSRKPATQIALELGRPTATIRDRINNLEESGIIKGYTVHVDLTRLGYEIKAIIHISVLNHIIDPQEFFEALRKIPEVASVQLLTGDYEAVVTVYVHNVDHLQRILYQEILKVPWISSTNTSIVLLEQEWSLPRGGSSNLPESQKVKER